MAKMLEWKTAKQFVVFVLVGAGSAVLDIAAMQLLLSLSFDFPLAVTVGFVAGVLANYAGHARITFQSKPQERRLLRFLAVVAINYLLTMVFVVISNSIFDSVLVGKLISLPVIAANGYLLSRIWVFKID